VQAGVRVFFYLEDRERTFDSPTDKLLMSVTAFADELERERARQRTYDAMQRKAQAGHVTGGRVFGYDNVEVLGADGKRSHVERRINEAEASVVGRIFEMSASGSGLTAIAKALNADRVPKPRPQLGRAAAWIASSVRAVLHRPLYCGDVIWNRTRKRNAWGQKHQLARPEGAWLRVESRQLRLVSEELWAAAHAEMARRREQWACGDRSYRGSRYLLSGFARCAVCGGGFSSHLRTHGTGARRFLARFYGCTSHWERGATVCNNRLVADMATIDAEVVATIEDDVLRPNIVERAIALALEELGPDREEAQRARLAAELAEVNDEHAAVTAAMSRGGDVKTIVGLVERLQALEARRADLTKRRDRLGG
jgi:site-specific DNA recombinase